MSSELFRISTIVLNARTCAIALVQTEADVGETLAKLHSLGIGSREVKVQKFVTSSAIKVEELKVGSYKLVLETVDSSEN